MYHKKDATTDTSTHDKVLNTTKKLNTSYNPTMPRIHEPVMKGKYEVTRYKRVIQITREQE